jgi:hypothetical protein
LFKNDWVPFVCGTDVSVEISATKVPIRTRGDGHWKKYTYQDLSFTITLSGLLTFDDDNWTGWDMLDNQFNFSHVLARVSFEDADGDIKTVQGYVMIETSTLSYSPGNLVKDDFQLQGNGKLIMFDGLVPCPSVIVDMTINGQTDDDGVIHVNYTFTGDPYQVKYRVDDSGDWIYAIAGVTLDIPGLAIANHTIEIIPVCANGFEGTGRVERFQVTQGLSCGTVISDITINDDVTAAQAVYTGSATQMRYRVDGGVWLANLITFIVPLGGLSVGDHTIEMVPVCANNVEGTGFEKDFTKDTQPAQSQLKYETIFSDAGVGTFNIYVNGVLTISLTDTATESSINVATGSTVKVVMTIGGGRSYDLLTEDQTLSTSLDHQAGATSVTINRQYIFTPSNGDTYKITGTITDE